MLQERLLSRRILHFTSAEVVWECTELNASESFPDGTPDHTYSSFTPFSKKQFSFPLLEAVSRNGRLSPTWGAIVDEYTQCGLTKHSDKVVALAGLARRFQQQHGGEYLAGLWRSEILGQLCWKVITSGRRISCHERAPSWSWASIMGDVFTMWDFSKRRFVATLLEVAIDLVNPAFPLGAVRGGTLRLRAPLLRIEQGSCGNKGFRFSSSEDSAA